MSRRVKRLLRAEPAAENRYDVRLLLVGERLAAGDLVPLRKAPATTGGRRVLGDEDGMATKGCLLAVVRRRRRREAPGDELLGLDEHAIESARRQICLLGCAEVKAAPEGGVGEGSEEIVERTHDEIVRPAEVLCSSSCSG